MLIILLDLTFLFKHFQIKKLSKYCNKIIKYIYI